MRSFLPRCSTTSRPRAPGRAIPWLLAILTIAPASLVLVAQEARADSTAVSAWLPTQRYDGSVVWTGTHAYLFGGWDGLSRLNQIVSYRPATNAVSTMTETLPTARQATSAVWDGQNAYIFGGWDGFSHLNQIVRYDPATHAVTTMTATLPSGRYGTSAVWDGQYAYIFGGWDGLSYLNQIVRYHPATNTVTTMAATLPTGTEGSSAVWDGQSAYIFGGRDSWASLSNKIVRYNPATGTVTTIGSPLPSGRWGTSAAWDGQNAYVFGGDAGFGGPVLSQIVRYHPATNTVTTMAATLPSARSGTGAVWNGQNAYVFGGGDGAWYLDQIVRYRLEPGAPRSLTATAGPGTGEIRLSWQPPADNTYSSNTFPITSYKVYRATSSGGSYSLIASPGNVLSYTDTGVPNGATRYYKVSAVNAAGESPQSSVASATTFTTPSAPQNLQATPDTGETTLTWQAPSSNGGTPITNYRIYRSTSIGGQKTFLAQVGNVLTYDTTCSPGTTCFYQVTAVNAVGEGPRSNEASTVGTAVDLDQDGVPDVVEPTLCANENPNFNFDGTCVGSDYSPPTAQGILEDLEKFP